MRKIRRPNRIRIKEFVIFHDYECSCKGKKCHASRYDAEQARLHTPNGEKMRSYRCRHCKFWHIGKRKF